MFKTKHSKLASLHTPTRQRERKFLSLLKCFVAPIQTMQNDFETNRNNNIYKLNHNGQICKLVSVLNDTFDKDQRRIYITDNGDSAVLLIHKDTDQKLVQLPVIVHRNEDYSDSGYDFVVCIPSDIILTREKELHIKSVVNYYKLAGKRYEINVV